MSGSTPTSLAAAQPAGFYVSGGQIIGPNGQPFKAHGIDILESTLGNVVSDPSCAPLLTKFPGTNMVRIVMESGYSSYNDPSFVNAVNWLTAKGIVVEIANYDAPEHSVSTGALLTSEVNWYTALATIYKSNPYVWLSSDNEPQDTYAGLPAGSITAEHNAMYNAIRATGNTNIIGVNPANSRTTYYLTPTSSVLYHDQCLLGGALLQLDVKLQRRSFDEPKSAYEQYCRRAVNTQR